MYRLKLLLSLSLQIMQLLQWVLQNQRESQKLHSLNDWWWNNLASEYKNENKNHSVSNYNISPKWITFNFLSCKIVYRLFGINLTCPSPCIADCLNCCWARSCCWGNCINFCCCCCCCCFCCWLCCWGDGVFIMVVLDLGELAYGSGDVVVLSKFVILVAPGDAADLPISCDPETCFWNCWVRSLCNSIKDDQSQI